MPGLIALLKVIKVVEWDYDLCNHHLVARSHSSAGYESDPNHYSHPGNSWPVVQELHAGESTLDLSALIGASADEKVRKKGWKTAEG